MYKALETSIVIPDFIQKDIQLLLDYLNSGKDPGLADIYTETIRADINGCIDLDFSRDASEVLKDYYCRGGILNADD